MKLRGSRDDVDMAPALIGRRPGAASAREPECLILVCCVQSLQVDGRSDHDNHSNRKKGEHPLAYRISVAVLTIARSTVSAAWLRRHNDGFSATTTVTRPPTPRAREKDRFSKMVLTWQTHLIW